MREILFKGKRVDNGEWVYGFLVKRPSAVYIGEHNPWAIIVPPGNPDENASEHFVEPSTISQYTGLSDMNGKKIFEGDIISIPFEEDGDPWEGKCTYYEKAKVYFDTKRYGWYVDFCDNDEFSLWEYDETDIEVIGNIHDNPELLEE